MTRTTNSIADETGQCRGNQWTREKKDFVAQLFSQMWRELGYAERLRQLYVARFPQDSERRVSALRRKLREIINIAKVYQVVGTKYIERATYCTQ